MNKKIIALIVIIIGLVVLGAVWYAHMSKNENTENYPDEIPSASDEDITAIDRIDAKHFYEDGVHTIAGEVMMPTPCDLLESSTAVVDSEPPQATINLMVINNSPNQCAQVITPQRFKISFQAQENVEIDATYRGKPITLNLIEASPDEDPDDFELFIKG